MRQLVLVGVFAALVSPAFAQETPEFLNSEGMPPDLPFSEAVRLGDTVYLSGQIGNLPGTLDLAPGGMEGEAKQVMDNVKAVLERHGLGMQDLVKCTVMLADMSEWGAFNDIYRTYFEPGRFPARAAFGANGLAVGAKVEVDCIAAAK
ncbi:RidA family protein [Paracoccus sp. M683]|uniref:RidA family protein n=1 Tax=Paracoccus sp. M683 TaxID=2594268 RepID=UPI001180A4F0|nr:RidA family protein [Paracoccus sp. M683]TRW98858.1 RidA family protein [Paracoccus sp. M683]